MFAKLRQLFAPRHRIVPDPFRHERDALRLLPAAERVQVLRKQIHELRAVVSDTESFHRKALMRMLDHARVEAGQATREDLIRETSYQRLDFSKATLVFKSRQ